MQIERDRIALANKTIIRIKIKKYNTMPEFLLI